jgi:serine/threonine-protein kinase RsbW
MTMERTDHKREIILDIPSEDKYIYLLDLVVSYITKEMEFGEEITEQINLAIIEAGTNAIRHGNRNDPEKTAQFRFLISEDKLTVFVKDRGSGFDPESVGDPLSPENFMKPCGRGIFLMRALMDEVEYNTSENSGTEVRMVKYKSSKK